MQGGMTVFCAAALEGRVTPEGIAAKRVLHTHFHQVCTRNIYSPSGSGDASSSCSQREEQKSHQYSGECSRMLDREGSKPSQKELFRPEPY
jgi:hypothetical protein